MPKMNKGQLDHLDRRLSEKLALTRKNHPITAQIKVVQTQRGTLVNDQRATVAKMSKADLLQVVTDQLDKGHKYGGTLADSIKRSAPAKSYLKKEKGLLLQIDKLKKLLDRDMAKHEVAKQAVFDQAVFADSPEDVLKVIADFMA